jgi:hypothetical protein
MSTEQTKLEPCPFCGKPLTAKRWLKPFAQCQTEGCFGRKIPVVSLDVPSDVEAWNTRASTASTAAAQPEARASAIEECIKVKVVLPGGFGGKSDEYLSAFQAGCHAFIDATRALPATPSPRNAPGEEK